MTNRTVPCEIIAEIRDVCNVVPPNVSLVDLNMLMMLLVVVPPPPLNCEVSVWIEIHQLILLLLNQHSMRSKATVDDCGSRSAVHFARIELSFIAQILVNFDSLWINIHRLMSVDILLDHGRTSASSSISVETLNLYLANKVAKVQY
jgi:hypothetical protein